MPPSSGPSWTCTAKARPSTSSPPPSSSRATTPSKRPGGAVYLADLAQAVVSGANAEYYATIVRDKSLQRGLINAARPSSATATMPRARWAACWTSPNRPCSPSRSAPRPRLHRARELVDSVFENLSKLPTPATSSPASPPGYTRLDKLTAGLQPSDLIIVAARPSMAKTAFSLCMGLNAAIRQGVPWPCSRWK